MRILIVDDDPRKCDAVREVIGGVLSPVQAEVLVRRNIHGGAQELSAGAVDLLILDMNIPLRDGEDAQPDAGLQFLRQLYSSRRYTMPRYILGLTAFKERFAEFATEFASRMWYLTLYEGNSNCWISSLTSLLLHIADTDQSRKNGYQTDLAIVTALEDVELQAVLALPAGWSQIKQVGDPTIYWGGSFAAEQRRLSVVAAAALEMGMPATTALSMKIIERFRPRYIAMAGIAAGVTGSPGDILVADVAFDYGSGKRKLDKKGRESFSPDPRPIPLDFELRTRLSYFKTRTDLINQIQSQAVGPNIPPQLKVLMGPMASGAAVLQNRNVVEQVQSLWRKLVGVEMETYGLFVAARMCNEPRPRAMSIKSICDFADQGKADDYQRYAAYTSCAFLHKFASHMLTDDCGTNMRG